MYQCLSYRELTIFLKQNSAKPPSEYSEGTAEISALHVLTLKAPPLAITIAADDIHKYFSLFFRENKT